MTDDDIQAAALQYVQTVSGYRLPAPADGAAFDQAVDRVKAATRELLVCLQAPTAPAVGT